MPDTKLSGLPTGSAIAGADLFYSAQGGASVKQPASALSSFIQTTLGSSPTSPFLNFVYDFGGVGDDSTNNNVQWKAACASGKSIYIPPGTYRIYGALGETDPSQRIGTGKPTGNQIFFGIPGATIISFRTSTPNAIGQTVISNTHPVFWISGVSDILIDGITFKETSPAVEAGFTKETAIAITAGVSTLNYPYASRIRITNCKFINCTAIHCGRWSEKVWIDNNHFDGGAIYPLPHAGYGALGGFFTGGESILPLNSIPYQVGGYATVRDIFLTNNYFTNYRQEPVDINLDTRRMVIANNIFVNSCSNDGFNAETMDIGGNNGTNDLVVTGNLIFFDRDGLIANGLHIKPGQTEESGVNRIVCSDNWIYSTHDVGTAVTTAGTFGPEVDVIISNNSITGFASQIIANTTHNLIITGNTLKEAHVFGIQVSGNSGFTLPPYTGEGVKNLNISDNIIEVADDCTQNAIQLNGAINWVVRGNVIANADNSGFAGVLINASCAGGIFSDNVIDGCDQGIKSAADGVIISNNVVRNCDSQGIYVLTCQHVSVTGNICYNNGQGGVTIPGILINPDVSYCNISNNIVYDNQIGAITGFSITNGGAGYNDSLPTFFPTFTGGTGTGLTVQCNTIWSTAPPGHIHYDPTQHTIIDGHDVSDRVAYGGTGYKVGDVVTIDPTSQMGAGTGATFSVDSIYYTEDAPNTDQGAVIDVTLLSAGSGYTGSPTHFEQAAIGGSGRGAYFNFGVQNGVIVVASIDKPGTEYQVGDTLTFGNNAEIGNSGTGLLLTVTSVAASATQDGIYTTGNVQSSSTSTDKALSFNNNIIGPVKTLYTSGSSNLQNISNVSFPPNILTGTVDTIYGQIPGTIRVDSAVQGNVGESVEVSVTTGSAVSLTTGTAADVMLFDITTGSTWLSAGDWDIWATVIFKGNVATTVDKLEACINTTSATITTSQLQYLVQSFTGTPTIFANGDYTLGTIGPFRHRVAGEITSAAVTNPGSGYTTADVTYTSTRGLRAIIHPTIAGGTISALPVSWGGKDYTTGDTIAITGDGSGATGTIAISSPILSVYLVAKATFAVNTCNVYGVMRAKRRR